MGKLKENINGRLHQFCEALTPKRRLIIIIVVGALFTVINLFITIVAVYDIVSSDRVDKGAAYIELPIGDILKENYDEK